ncbi:MAG: DUF2520 domain-containing protein [Bacteroidota bacterium]
MKLQKLEFVIVGCGNLAWHLAKKISKYSNFQLKVYNHQDNAKLQSFKDKFNCETFSSLKSVSKTADFYFICVNDKAIPDVVKKMQVSKVKGLVMHCSGSQPLSLLGAKSKNTAVFYPLQTFTKEDKIHWSEVPIILEAANAAVLERLKSMVKLFSDKMVVLTYEERLQLHLAAVFANNFVNAMFVEAYQLLPKLNAEQEDLLFPLMKQTVMKLEKVNPLNAQTGPAKRKDQVVMGKHLELIKNQVKLKRVYQNMSELIMLQQKKIHD